jgi:8-oxo-dGTP diphosphatase
MDKYCYEYPRPALTVDSIVFSFEEQNLKVLLIKRADDPFKDRWAFPGGFVNEGETVEIAVLRELLEETGMKELSLEQIYTASAPGRDPRGWTVSVFFIGFISGKKVELIAGDDAKEAAWHSILDIPQLAFDHAEIIEKALLYIRTKMRFLRIASQLLNEHFTRVDLINLGRQIGIQATDLNQRLNRFIRAGLIIDSPNKDQLCINMEMLEKLK